MTYRRRDGTVWPHIRTLGFVFMSCNTWWSDDNLQKKAQRSYTLLTFHCGPTSLSCVGELKLINDCASFLVCYSINHPPIAVHNKNIYCSVTVFQNPNISWWCNFSIFLKTFTDNKVTKTDNTIAITGRLRDLYTALPRNSLPNIGSISEYRTLNFYAFS